MFEGNVSPGNHLGIVRRHSFERTRDLRTVRPNLLPRSLGHVPLVLDQLTAKVLLQTDQGTFSVHPSPHRTRQFRESLRVHEALIACVDILGRQSEPPPVAHPRQQLNQFRLYSVAVDYVSERNLRSARIRVSLWSWNSKKRLQRRGTSASSAESSSASLSRRVESATLKRRSTSFA